MKIKTEDFAVLESKIKDLLSKHPEAAKQYKDKELSHKRFRWDVFHAIGGNNLYAYMNDEHIDTALRAILGKDF